MPHARRVHKRGGRHDGVWLPSPTKSAMVRTLSRPGRGPGSRAAQFPKTASGRARCCPRNRCRFGRDQQVYLGAGSRLPVGQVRTEQRISPIADVKRFYPPWFRPMRKRRLPTWSTRPTRKSLGSRSSASASTTSPSNCTCLISTGASGQARTRPRSAPACAGSPSRGEVHLDGDLVGKLAPDVYLIEQASAASPAPPMEPGDQPARELALGLAGMAAGSSALGRSR